MDKNKTICLSKSQISEFLDCNNALNTAQRQHLDCCPKCKALLNIYKANDLALKNKMLASDIDLENLRKNVHAKIINRQSPPPAQTNFTLFDGRSWRIAAAFIFCAVLMFFAVFKPRNNISVNNGKTTESFQPPADYPENSIASNSAKNKRLLAEKLPYYSIGSKDFYNNHDALPLNALQAASFGTRSAVSFTDYKHDPNVHIINDYVNQVWVCSSLQDCKLKIVKICKDLKIPAECLKISVNKKAVVNVSLSLSKMQLVYFVRACEKAGLSLISSQAPQPEQTRFAGLANQTVSYHAKFVLQQ